MKNIFFLIIAILFISCEKNETRTIVRGNIPNLPDGTMFLFRDDPSNILDSTKTINGRFVFDCKLNDTGTQYIGIYHMDDKRVKRIFSFITNAKYKGVPKWGTSLFMSDSLIFMNGNLIYNKPLGIKLPPNIKMVTGPPLKAGKQTEVFYNIDGDLFERVNNNTANVVKEKLLKYPYSYHLLYKIDENKNSFTAQQIEEYLKLFKGDIVQSETYKILATYNKKRFNKKNIAIPLLEDNKGIKKEIADKKYKKHLIIFWASWCAPCRIEIPMLKKMYSKYGNDIEFVSISTDTDKAAWQKALQQENMNWKQLITSNNPMETEALQIRFRVNQAIPYTVLIDNNFKVLSFSTGLSNEKELEDLLKK